MKLTLIIFGWISCVLSADNKPRYVKILGGRTGSGKSYISNIKGCKSKICSVEDEEKSCTDSAVYCAEQGIIDSVGLDDDEIKVIRDKGREIKLSGYTYPIYNLLETLEEQKISQVEFYIVYDINNVRDGSSGKFFKDFVSKYLQCPFTRVLNKYRLNFLQHNQLVQTGDILVLENAQKVDLNGQSCTLALSKNWRESLFDQDLEAIKSLKNVSNCILLREKEKEYEMYNSQQPNDYPPPSQLLSYPEQKDCSYQAKVSYICKFQFYGFCLHRESAYETKVNQDCVNRRKEENERITYANEKMQQEREKEVKRIDELNKELRLRQDNLRSVIIEIEKELIECRVLIANIDL